jgi:hypothetical protein
MRDVPARAPWLASSMLAALCCVCACQGSVDAPPGGNGSAPSAAGTNNAGSGGSGASGRGNGGRAGNGGGAGSGATAGAGIAGQGGGSALPSALESAARRLTRSELDAVVRDVFGDETQPAAGVLQEDEYGPFDNDYTRQRASAALIDSVEAFATEVAARALDAHRDRVVPCTPAAANDAACFSQSVIAIGTRLFRRPLTTEEVDAYGTLQAFSTEDVSGVENDFYTGIELVLRSMLQDPEFLYRIEIGTAAAHPEELVLNDYEIATRMSFLLWGSTPDDALLEAARDGELTGPAGRRAAAERLLTDDRARSALHRFHAMWLGYRAIPHTPDLVAAFDRETTQLIDRVIFDQPSSYLSLFLSPETYIDDRLAEHYGLARPSNGQGWVSYGSSRRAGILSHGSVLAGFSKFSDTSPTQRGIFVQTRLLCNTIDAPPANVNVDQPPGSDDAACKSERYREHRASPSCAGCHADLDPIGFGLEEYDVGGRLRTHDDGHEECVISGEGELPGYGTFRGPGELAQKLVDSGELSQCFVQHLLSYAIGRALRPSEAALVTSLEQDFAASGYDARTLLVDYVASGRFALRREERAP